MTAVAREPDSIWRNIVITVFAQLGFFVIGILMVSFIYEKNLLSLIKLLIAEDLPLRLLFYLVVASALLGWLTSYFSHRERRLKWVIESGSIDIYRDNTLLCSLNSNDIIRIIYHDTSVGVFTRNHSGYYKIRNLPKGSGDLIKQSYEVPYSR